MEAKKIKVFFYCLRHFILDCFKYPLDIVENYEDAKSIYFFSTDPEMQKLFKEIEGDIQK